jgi:hypothetical protein
MQEFGGHGAMPDSAEEQGEQEEQKEKEEQGEQEEQGEEEEQKEEEEQGEQEETGEKPFPIRYYRTSKLGQTGLLLIRLFFERLSLEIRTVRWK